MPLGWSRDPHAHIISHCSAPKEEHPEDTSISIQLQKPAHYQNSPIDVERATSLQLPANLSTAPTPPAANWQIVANSQLGNLQEEPHSRNSGLPFEEIGHGGIANSLLGQSTLNKVVNRHLHLVATSLAELALLARWETGLTKANSAARALDHS